MRWQMTTQPSQRSVLTRVAGILMEQCFSLQDIRQCRDEDWKELDIPIRLGKRLRDEMKMFCLERRNNTQNIMRTSSAMDALANACVMIGNNEEDEFSSVE